MRSQRIGLLRLLICYVLFTAPLLLALLEELGSCSPPPSSLPPSASSLSSVSSSLSAYFFPTHESSNESIASPSSSGIVPSDRRDSAVTLVVWMVVLLFVYGTVRAIGENTHQQLSGETASSYFNKSFQNIIFRIRHIFPFLGLLEQKEPKVKNQEKVPSFKYHRRNVAEHLTDVLFIVLFFGYLSYPHILQPFLTHHSLSFLASFLFFFLIYIFLFESCEAVTKLTLTAKVKKNPIGLIIVLVSSCIVLSFVYHHMMCVMEEDRKEEIFWHHIKFWSALLVQMVIFLIPFDEKVSIHIHHYYWPLTFLQLCVFSWSQVSFVTCAMLCAISMHGIAFFGVKPLIYYDRWASERCEVCQSIKSK